MHFVVPMILVRVHFRYDVISHHSGHVVASASPYCGLPCSSLRINLPRGFPRHCSGCMNSVFRCWEDWHKETPFLPLTLSQSPSEGPSQENLAIVTLGFQRCSPVCELPAEYKLRFRTVSCPCAKPPSPEREGEVPMKHSSLCSVTGGLSVEWPELCFKAMLWFHSPSFFLFLFLSKVLLGIFLLLPYRGKRMWFFFQCAKAMEFHSHHLNNLVHIQISGLRWEKVIICRQKWPVLWGYFAQLSSFWCSSRYLVASVSQSRILEARTVKWQWNQV